MAGYSLLYNVDLQLLNHQNEENTIDNLFVLLHDTLFSLRYRITI